jgi:hypothetical protein
MFSTPAAEIHAAMLARCVPPGSLGWNTRPGDCVANHATCSPVPLAISSTVPVTGRQRRSTAAIGSRLRSAEGEDRRSFMRDPGE